jgi:S1-C subfamily serine protease
VAVTDVDPNGIAAAKGLTAGDIILDVSNNPVRAVSRYSMLSVIGFATMPPCCAPLI